jgi:Rieske Fe-S protein
MDNAKNAPETAGPSRRTVLLGAGSAGAVALLAACGSPGATGTSQPAGGGAGTGTVSGDIDLGPATDIPVGGGKVYPDHAAVVTQPTAGQFKAFNAICTHMHCTVGDVANGTINCPCHGSRYSITDGSVVQGPAPKALAPKTVEVKDGDVHLT